MVLYTPNLNLPYVQPVDVVTNYPVTSQDLASKLDTRLTNPPRIVLGRSGNTSTLPVSTDTLVPFDVTRETSGAADFTVSGGVITVVKAGTYVMAANVDVWGGSATTFISAFFLSGSAYSIFQVLNSTATMTGRGAGGCFVKTLAAGATVAVYAQAGAAGFYIVGNSAFLSVYPAG